MILVTGGTGFVGRSIVGKLLEEDQKVCCLVRPTSRRDFFQDNDVEYREGDITDRESLTNVFSDVDVVIHLVGIIKELKGLWAIIRNNKSITFAKVHAGGTRNVVDAAKEAGVKKFIYMSAMGVRPGAVSCYHKTKWEGEEAVRNSGVPYVIFRPSIICGKDDDFVNMFARMVRFPGAITRTFIVAGSGRSKLQPISVRDVAACFVRAALDDDIGNKEYELGGGEQFSFNEFMDVVMRVMGKRRFKVHIPAFMFWPLALTMEYVHPSPPLTRDQLKMLKEDNVGDITAMKEGLGVEPAEFEEVISEYLIS